MGQRRIGFIRSSLGVVYPPSRPQSCRSPVAAVTTEGASTTEARLGRGGKAVPEQRGVNREAAVPAEAVSRVRPDKQGREAAARPVIRGHAPKIPVTTHARSVARFPAARRSRRANETQSAPNAKRVWPEPCPPIAHSRASARIKMLQLQRCSRAWSRAA